ncbi:hypothetical protein [Stenotrophomonas geniculata]|uniref:Uncharacterized protein n=1 Tax=Stenotrophomonas geniculata N1 TaxID=1167641 RepID=A0A0L8AEU8_9GAMM|nr:hypothetical protein [Stenotrophomonas geniculata]KOF00675.1 hypothetical protein W7K_02905 [Stenotrophomonas geniculata N1]
MELNHRIQWKKVAIYTCLIAVGFTIAFVLLAFTGQVQFGKDAPAWVQAVGSVVGIAVAITIPLTTSRRDERRKEQADAAKARTYALHLMPQADRLHNRLRSVNLLMMDPDDEEEDEMARALEVLKDATQLDAWGYQLHELGKPGELLQKSIAAAVEALTLLEDQDFYDRYNGQIVDDRTGEIAEFEKPKPATPALLRAESLAEKSAAALRELFL